MNEAIKPTRTFNLWNNAVEIRLFGRNGGVTNWSIAAMNDDGIRNKTDAADRVFRTVHQLAEEAKVQTIYAPRPDFSARVCHWEDLTLGMHFHNEAVATDMGTYNIGWNFHMYRGAAADGCIFPRNSAYGLSSGDCWCGIVRAPKTGHLICCHIGFKSLFDLDYIRDGEPGRLHESIVDAVVDQFKSWGDDIPSLEVFLTCGIREGFKLLLDDSPEKEFNHRVAAYIEQTCEGDCISIVEGEARLNLPEIIRGKFRKHRVVEVADDGKNTLDELETEGENKDDYMWWSYERAKTDKDRLKRNFVMVIRRD